MRNHSMFLSLDDCPSTYNIVPEKFSYLNSKRRYFCLVAELPFDDYGPSPADFVIYPRGTRSHLNFELDGEEPLFWKLSDLNYYEEYNQEFTICIFTPFVTEFPQGRFGIVIESRQSSMLFPSTLNVLLAESDALTTSTSTHSTLCSICNQKATKTCHNCKILRYCGKRCQRKHWKAGHKKLCTHVSTLLKICHHDFSQFYDYEGHKRQEDRIRAKPGLHLFSDPDRESQSFFLKKKEYG